MTISTDHVLPDMPEEFATALQAAQDNGSVHLFSVDEAEVRAVGAPRASRAGRPPWVGYDYPVDHPVIEAAAGRLVARGLATPTSWANGQVTPAGGLLGYLRLALHPKAHVGTVATWLAPEVLPASRGQVRINVLIDVVRGGLACIERTDVPVPDSEPPLAVGVDVVRLDVLVDLLVESAFGGVGAAEGVRETGVVFSGGKRAPDGGAAIVTTRLDVSLRAGTAMLRAPRKGVLGTKMVTTPVSRAEFADHLRLRLMSAR